MSDLSQQQLEEIVEGKPQAPRIVFYDKARMNVEKSKIAGHRIYDTMTYLKETQAGVTDWIPQKARPEHIKKYPVEFQNYMDSRKGEKSPPIDIIPNITPAQMQELIDYGLGTIRLLAEAEQVPPHLNTIHRNAKVLHAVFTEQYHGEERSDSTNQFGEEEGEVRKENPRRLLSEANRFHDTPDVEQCLVPFGTGIPEGKASEGVQTGRRIHHNQVLSTDWSMGFKL
jgi:hypothetical protein